MAGTQETISIKGMNEDLEGLMSLGVQEVWLIGYLEWKGERCRWTWTMIAGHSGQRNSDQSYFPSRLPAKEALGGPNYLNCSMIMAALCSQRHRSALYLDEQAGAGEGRCSQGHPLSWAPGICQAGVQLLSASCFFPFLVEWRKPLNGCFSTDIYSNVIGLGLMRSSSSVKSAW